MKAINKIFSFEAAIIQRKCEIIFTGFGQRHRLVGVYGKMNFSKFSSFKLLYMNNAKSDKIIKYLIYCFIHLPFKGHQNYENMFNRRRRDTSNILAHLSRRLTGELIVYPPVVVRPSSNISKIFFSETAWPIKAKLNVEHP